MGDLPTDALMVREEDHDCVLKVGFVNEPSPTEEVLESYAKAFDVLLLGDGNLKPVVDLLYHISN